MDIRITDAVERQLARLPKADQKGLLQRSAFRQAVRPAYVQQAVGWFGAASFSRGRLPPHIFIVESRSMVIIAIARRDKAYRGL